MEWIELLPPLGRLQWAFFSRFDLINATIGPSPIHCVLDSMKKPLLCNEPAPILFSLSYASEVRPGKEREDRQPVINGGPSYKPRPGSTH